LDPAWLTALTALAVAVLGLLGWALRSAWRVLRRVTHFLDDYAGEPARDGMPARPGFMARLTSAENAIGLVLAETQPNHGGSLRDVVHKAADDIAEIKVDQAALRAQVEVLRAAREDR
jgi:hypothetical protein